MEKLPPQFKSKGGFFRVSLLRAFPSMRPPSN